MTKEYISRDEMIEQTRARIVLGAPKFNTGLEAAIEVATSISAADVVERPRWISVKERMPEDGKNVLAYEGGGFYFLDWCCNGDWVVASASTAVVTHWMPLPKPPKEET